MLQNIRALPTGPGGAYVWNQVVYHWGARSSLHAPEPRISFACEFQRGDLPADYSTDEAPVLGLRGAMIPFRFSDRAHAHWNWKRGDDAFLYLGNTVLDYKNNSDNRPCSFADLMKVKVNGARRWLNIGITRIQPSEIMKIAMPLMLAWWFQKREGQLRPLDFLAAGALLAVPAALIMKQPDLGTALLVLAAGLSVILFAGLSWKLIVPPVLLGLVGIGLVVFFGDDLCADGVRWPVLHDYQQQRICTLLDPTRDPLGKGFHIIQGMIAIGSGGVWGKGFMQGTQTHLEFIPERTTDFIFAAFSEEFGLAGCVALLLGFIFLIFRGRYLAPMTHTDASRALRAPSLVAAICTLAGAVLLVVYALTGEVLGRVILGDPDAVAAQQAWQSYVDLPALALEVFVRFSLTSVVMVAVTHR